MDWKQVDLNTPQNVELNTKIEDKNGVRNMQKMVLKGNIWWADDMYVYYVPTHWSW